MRRARSIPIVVSVLVGLSAGCGDIDKLPSNVPDPWNDFPGGGDGLITAPLHPSIEPAIDWKNPQALTTNPKFRVCYHWTCDRQLRVAISESVWKEARDRYFSTPASSEAQELQRVRWAVGYLEAQLSIRMGWYYGASSECRFHDAIGNSEPQSVTGRMDCVDTASNTMTFLTIMQAKGWLRFFRVADWIRRGGIVTHFAASVKRKSPRGDAADHWAIDPWLLSGAGRPADIQTVGEWKDKKPPKSGDNPNYNACAL